MSFQSIFPPSEKRGKSEMFWTPPLSALAFTILNYCNLSTLILAGACLQALLILCLPPLYALTPAFLLVITKILDTLAITSGLRKNPYLKGALLSKASAQVPSTDGEFHEEAAAEGVVILLLGAKPNHPLGLFAPNFPTTFKYIQKMSEMFDREAPDNGFLGQSYYPTRDVNGCIDNTLISYWRSVEDLHRFAHGPLHREAWAWWDATLKENDHIGIKHEIYAAAPGQWENIFVNYQPTGIGATTFLRRGDKLEGGVVPDQWISPLVQANRGKLRTSAGRLGQGVATQHDKYGPNVYEHK